MVRGIRSALKRDALRSSIGTCLAAVGLAATLAACSGGKDGQAGGGGLPPVFVEVVTAEPEPIRDVVHLVGQLEAEESVVVRPEIGGIVSDVLFQEGQRVEKGQELFRLRDEEERARLQKAEARWRLAADADRRMKALAEEKVVSEAENIRTERDLEAAAADLETARVRLDRTRIRAPFGGYAAARLISPGFRVNSDTDLVAVHATDRLKLAFALPEAYAQLARTGMPVSVGLAAYPKESFPGEVYFVAPAVDPRSRLLLLKASIANPDGRLRPGVFADVRVEIDRRDSAIVLPDSAIAAGTQGSYVWRIADGEHAERVQVELGIRRDGRVEIRRGLKAGDRVVSAGTNKLFPGAPVQPVAARDGDSSAPGSDEGRAGT
jgi:membrane fusion protein (multidrug efflux system)